MDNGEKPLSQLLDERWSLERSQYEAIACLTLATYEWLLLFEKEVELIHKKRWTWFKALFLACRYYPFVGLGFTGALWQNNHTRDTCLHLVRYQAAFLIGLQIFPYAILLVRCYVFLGRRRWFLIFSIVAISLGLVNQVVALCAQRYVIENQFKFTGKFGCFRNWQNKNWGSRYMGIALILPLIIDGVSTVAVLRHHWENREVHSPLSKLFVRQAILHFSVVLILFLLAGGFQLSGSLQLSGRALVALLTLPNLMACRLILQLREKRATLTPSETGQILSLVVRRGLHPEEFIE